MTLPYRLSNNTATVTKGPMRLLLLVQPVSTATPRRRIRPWNVASSSGRTRWPLTIENDQLSEYELYHLPDWDGYGALPITLDTVRAAREFYKLLPMETPTPDIAPGADGTIGFEWRLGSADARETIIFEVGPGNRVKARRILPSGKSMDYEPTSTDTGALTLIKQLFA